MDDHYIDLKKAKKLTLETDMVNDLTEIPSAVLGESASDLTYKDIIDKPAKYCAQCLFSGGKWEWASPEPEGSCRYKDKSLKPD